MHGAGTGRDPQNPEQRILLRSRVHWQSEAPSAINLRLQRQQQQSRRRAFNNETARNMREEDTRMRKERLARYLAKQG